MRITFTPDFNTDDLPLKEKYYDLTATGYPGFGLRIHPAGLKNWFYRYRIKNSVRIITLGSTSCMNFNGALKGYKVAKDLRSQGIDPKGVNPTSDEAPLCQDSCRPK